MMRGSLGVEWGHTDADMLVRTKGEDGPGNGYVVSTNLGTMTVTPAWKIRNVLSQPEAITEREAVESAATQL
jgi:hypothetical protein